MATRAYPKYAGTTRVLSTQYTAKCSANQHLVDKLAETREKVGNSNYGFTLKKAAENIAKEVLPITTFEQVVAIKGVGPTIAKQLGFSKSYNDDDNKTTKRGRAKKAPPPATSAASLAHDSSSTMQGQNRKPHAKTTAAASTKDVPSRKELAYQKALEEADSWKGKNLKWRLVLLIDQRERMAEHYASKVEQSGIPTEIRPLPIGDMCWIAQGFDDCGGETRVVAELMLGTIIERKEVSDLKCSLFGTRYHEQQLRLKDSGQPQVIFLVEGDTKKDLYKCPAETLHSTMWAIRIEKQNQVIQTAHMEETVQTLRRMHRRMLQRTFPSAFYSEALPAFAGPEIGGPRGRRQRDSFGEQRRKRRRRLESLHGLVFDEEPIPMAGMQRFVSYNELHAKVRRDREAGRRTIGSIHQGMLKQVATISDAKILPISSAYPTANALLRAYSNVPTQSERKKLLESLDISSNTVKAGTKTLGPRSSEEMYIAYGLDENRRESVDSATATVARMQPVDSQEEAGLQKVVAENVKRAPKSNQSAALRPPAASSSTNMGNVNPTRKTTNARPGDIIDLLSSDDEDEPGVPLPPAKRQQHSSASSESSASARNSGKGADSTGGTSGIRSTGLYRSAPSLALDSSDDELNEMLQGISKKKPTKAQPVIELG